LSFERRGGKRLPNYDGDYDDYYAGDGEKDLKFEAEAAPFFYGMNPNGIWVLRIMDTSPGKTGRFVSARLTITAR